MIFMELNRSQCKAYLIGCEDTQKAIIVDPNKDHIDSYLQMLAEHKLSLEFVTDTHTHADHRSAVSDMKALTGAKIIRHQLAPQPNTDIFVDDNDIINVGELELKVLYTPGHSPDSVSYFIEDRVLTGDVILIGGTGRSDFAGGDAGAQYDSITEKLFTLPDETLIYPGHDYRGNSYSTIGHEKEHNPRIAQRTKAEFIEIMAGLNLALPKRIQEVLLTNITEDDDNEINCPSITALSQVRRISVNALVVMIADNLPVTVVDVRTEAEYNGPFGHIKGSIHIPLKQLVERSSELDQYRKQRLILVCRAGVRSTTGAAILSGMGFSLACDMEGGMVTWAKKGLPVENISAE